MGADRCVSAQEREPNGNQLALAYLRSQCGSLFRRGFQLVAHRRQLYVRTAGTKVPLRLDLSASWQQVQERCGELQEHLGRGTYDPAAWQSSLGGVSRRIQGRELEALIDLWRRRKLAEGCSIETFRNDYERYLRRLDSRRPLSEASILRAIESFPAASERRRRVVRAYRQIAAACGAPWNSALLDPLQGAGRSMAKRETPFFTDEEIEAVIEYLRSKGRRGWWRVVALMAIYGLRPWEAWIAVPAEREDCILVPQGKKNSSGITPPRVVPPFHLEWIRAFDVKTALEAPLPRRQASTSIGGQITSVLERLPCLSPDGRRRTAYGFRHAYARRIHGPRYRVTDAHGALFMGHTVAVHNTAYRRWIAGSEDPLAAYGFGATSPDGE